MGQINMGRVLLGGLLAGLIINVGESVLNLVVVADQMQDIVNELGIEPVGSGGVIVYVVLGFLIGIAMVWLYAAIRPRYGAGPKTALIVGTIVWFLAWFWQAVGFSLFLGSWPMSLLIVGLGWSLVEVLLAALAGGWVYQEGEAGGAARSL